MPPRVHGSCMVGPSSVSCSCVSPSSGGGGDDAMTTGMLRADGDLLGGPSVLPLLLLLRGDSSAVASLLDAGTALRGSSFQACHVVCSTRSALLRSQNDTSVTALPSTHVTSRAPNAPLAARRRLAKPVTLEKGSAWRRVMPNTLL